MLRAVRSGRRALVGLPRLDGPIVVAANGQISTPNGIAEVHQVLFVVTEINFDLLGGASSKLATHFAWPEVSGLDAAADGDLVWDVDL